jgi:hypothetical protein
MSTMSGGYSSQDDGRLELSMAAMRSERRNRPRILLVVASVILLAALVNLLWTFTKRAAVATSLSRANASLANVGGVVDQLESLEEKRSSPRYDPQNDMEGMISRFAGQVGLVRPEVVVKNQSSAFKGFQKRTYATQIPESDPDLLLDWMARATDGVTFPGLEIELFKLTPGRTLENGKIAWSLDITFRRWERTP